MRFFGKHILRSVKRSPLQPLFILLTVVCSVAVAITALRLSVVFTEHSASVAGKEQLLGDLLISMRGDSDVRMLFCEDAEELIADKGEVVGEFRLSGFAEVGEQDVFLSVSAVDLEKADAFYQFAYTEYGGFTTEHLDSSAVLSVSAAEWLGVGIGDSFTLRVLGESFSYTVCAIAEESDLLSASDVLVSTHRVTRALASRVPAIAALGDAFAPYTRLFVRLHDASEGEAVKELLLASEDFANMNVELTARQAQYQFLALTQSVILWLPSLLILLLTVFLLLNALHFLQVQRRTDTALFCACGASEKQLAGLQYAENGAYALLGALGGMTLSFPLVRWAAAQYDWQTKVITPDPISLLFGFFWAVLLIEGCTAWHLYRHRMLPLAEQLQEVEGTPLPTTPKRMQLLSSGLAVLFFGIACVLPIKLRFIPAVGTLIFTVLFLFTAIPTLFGWIARAVAWILERFKRPTWSLLFACKRLETCSLLRHVARLFTVLLSLLFALTVCVEVLQEQMFHMTDAVVCDYVAANADAKTVEEIAAHPDVEGVLRFSYLPLVDVENGTTAFSFAVSDSVEDFIAFPGYPKERPTGDDAVLAVGLAQLVGAEVGDDLLITVNGVSHTFTVREIVDTHMHFVAFDLETLGMEYELLSINLREGADVERAYEELCAILEQNASVLIDPVEIFDTIPQTVTSHVTVLRSGVAVAASLTLACCIHVLSQLYHAQKREHAILCQNGMTRGGIRRMILVELLLSMLFSALFSIVFGSLLCAIADFGIRSFGIVLFL